MTSNYFDAILEEAGAFSLLGDVPLTGIGSDTKRRVLHLDWNFTRPLVDQPCYTQQVSTILRRDTWAEATSTSFREFSRIR